MAEAQDAADSRFPIMAPEQKTRGQIFYFDRWLVNDGADLRVDTPVASITTQRYPQDRHKRKRDIIVRAPRSGVIELKSYLPQAPIGPGERIAYVRRASQTSNDKREDDPTLELPSPPPSIHYRPIMSVDYISGSPSASHSASAPVRRPPSEIRSAITNPEQNKHGVFISYRRSDEPAFAGRLYDHLVNAFDKSTVFMDVDSIDLGLDFVDVLRDALDKCSVVIVVIGQDWLSATDDLGAQRLANPDDFVRLEVEVALQRGLRVIPVLVDGAPMPRSTKLPTSMAKLARRNGREVSNARFGSDTIELINTLRRILGSHS